MRDSVNIALAYFHSTAAPIFGTVIKSKLEISNVEVQNLTPRCSLARLTVQHDRDMGCFSKKHS
jgi:hypothetical protein